MKNCFIIFFLVILKVNSQNIGDFISVNPTPQNTDFVIPPTHTFQAIISEGDALTQGGTLPGNTDFTGYVPIGGNSENGYLSINAELAPGAVSILDINFNSTSKLWSTSYSQAVDFSDYVLTAANCSGTVTPWNTIISCEEYTSEELFIRDEIPLDNNNDGYHDLGWAVEIDPVTKTVIDKRWALGNFKHENLIIHSNERTAYQGADAAVGYLYKFVADNAQDLSSGKLYVYKGSKNGPGDWILLNNTTKDERNTTVDQSTTVGATVFNGIEDVEIGPDGFIYFAVKSEDQVYRFQDSDPISGTTVINMETFVGNTTYNITHSGGTTNVNWGYGNDNLAFDNDGNLWVLNDGENNYIWVVKNGHTQASPKVEVFGIAPAGAEPTGITFSPDFRFLFMSIQHPNPGNNSTTQTDAAGNEVPFNNDVALVIALEEDLGATTEYTWYLDTDDDGYAIPPTVTSSTSPGTGYTQNILPLTDCDDNDPNVFEVSTWYLDADGDNYAVSPTVESCASPGTGYTQNILPLTDCDDSDPNVFEVSTWYLDADGDNYAVAPTLESCISPGTGYTQNVLPLTDCDDSDPNEFEVSTWYLDADDDGYTTSESIENCGSPGNNYTDTPSDILDCDDSDPYVFEVTTWYLDADGDNYAVAPTLESCISPGTGYTQNVLPLTDCDDSDPNVFEVSTWYLDADDDGYTTSESIENCGNPGNNYTDTPSDILDCDDSDPYVFEVTTWYLDADGDNYAVALTLESCNSPEIGYTQNVLPLTDCDDSDPNVFEVSTWYLDADGDGYTTSESIENCGNPGNNYTANPSVNIDCDDSNQQINPDTIWRLDIDNDGTADNEEIITGCINPGVGYTYLTISPYSIHDNILLYPNPTSEMVEIDLGQIESDINLTLVNSSKQFILSKNFQGQRYIKINISTLSSGIYFVEITNQEQVIGTQKIIKL